MRKNFWKETEELVALIEKSLDPNSRIELNVQLPIINSLSGKTAQCDVVIITSSPHGETISIIEVQDRNSKVEIGHLRNWLGKLDDVGGQHLICVSRQEFPSSIKEKAAQNPNKIRLIKLSELSPENVPLDFFNLNFRSKTFFVSEVKELTAGVRTNKSDQIYINNYLSDIKLHDEIFSFDMQSLYSYLNIVHEYFKVSTSKTKGMGKLIIPNKSQDLYVKVKNKFIKIFLLTEFIWEYKIQDVSPALISYEQNEKGTLAWVASAEFDSNKGKIWLKVPIIKENGEYKISSVLGGNLPNRFNLTIFTSIT